MRNILLLIILILLITSCRSNKSISTIEKYDQKGNVIEKTIIHSDQSGFIQWSNKERVFDVRILNMGI
jgi:hypothetical protein